MEPEVYYKIYRKARYDWVEYVNMCHKWTQTSTKCSCAISKVWECSSKVFLQAEVNRVVELYNLTGSRDLNTKQAISDVINHQYNLEDGIKLRKLLQRKIGRRVTHRKYYDKKKKDLKHSKSKDRKANNEDMDANKPASDVPNTNIFHIDLHQRTSFKNPIPN